MQAPDDSPEPRPRPPANKQVPAKAGKAPARETVAVPARSTRTDLAVEAVEAMQPVPAQYPQAFLPSVAPGSGRGRSRADRLSISIRRLWRAIAALLILGVGGFLIDGANRPANPKLVAATDPTAARGSPAFGTATLSVSSRVGAPACVLEAVSPQQQAFGLMGRTSVAPYAGMVFVFAAPSTEGFWMRKTLIPLSIAWFNAQGRFEAETLMPPCPAFVRNCPVYGPGQPYSLAVEVPAGHLGSLGIGPGSVAQVGGPCGG